MNTLPKAENPFGNQAPAVQQGGAMMEAESQRAIQEVQAAMVIAKKFPRNEREAMDRIINACTRPTLANSALYSYPRGGQEVTGPSIRLAEAIAQTWRNMQFGIRELSQSNGESTVEAFAWDVENNTRQVKIFQVPHVRHTRNGSKKLTDPRDIYELVANQGARRLRTCILGVIPGDVIEAAVNQCAVTQQASVDTDPETIKKMVTAFGPYKVTKELIELRIGKRIEAILPAQVLALKKIYQSLRDGMSKPGDWFEILEEPATAPVSDVQEMLAKAKADLDDTPTPVPEKETKAAATKNKPASKHSPAYTDIMRLIDTANTSADLDAVISLGGWDLLIEGEAPMLQKAIESVRGSLTDPA